MNRLRHSTADLLDHESVRRPQSEGLSCGILRPLIASYHGSRGIKEAEGQYGIRQGDASVARCQERDAFQVSPTRCRRRPEWNLFCMSAVAA